MPQQRPSDRWTSYEDWDHGTMKQRLEVFMASINKTALLEHAELVLGSAVSMSEPFSAGQYWCRFECVSQDGRLLIARVRLPKHLDRNASDEAEAYIMQCEVATMAFLRHNAPTVPLPTLYACEGPGSPRAAKAGAPYMLIEGFYGNSLQDVAQSVYNLPAEAKERILSQWATFQVQLGVFSFPQIGSISSFSKDTGPAIGPLATAFLDGLPSAGPFSSAQEYLAAVAESRLNHALQNSETTPFTNLGLFTFLDIMRNTPIFNANHNNGPFPLNHMDMGIQNLHVDDDFNILAVIDWEMAQSAPWDIGKILADPEHLAPRNTLRQTQTREMYRAKFAEAEAALGASLSCSIAEVLGGKSSRIYGTAEKIGVFDGMEEMLTRELVRLGYGLVWEAAEKKLEELEAEMKAPYPEARQDGL